MILGRRGRSRSPLAPRARFIMKRLVFLLLLHATAIRGLMFTDGRQDACQRKECSCLDSGHPSWTMVNCSMTPTQKLQILDGDLPESTTDIIVNGAAELTIGTNALSPLRDIRLLSVSGVRLVVLRTGAAIGLNVVSAYVEIADCDVLRVEKRAFKSIKGPLSVTIRNCEHVSLEGEAFSWLLKMSIINVTTLVLSPGTFALDPTAANVGEHGPGMSIELTNLTAPDIPAQSFGSSAAEITMKAVVVRAVRPGAFSANTYNVITATDCSFHIIEGEAFAQNSLINNLNLEGCKIHQLSSRALQSAISKLLISHTRFDIIETGAINATVASVRIADCDFHKFLTNGMEFQSWTRLFIQRSKFDSLPANAIVAPPVTTIHELFFVENEMEKLVTNSLAFIGQTFASRYAINIVYKNNYIGVLCHCNISDWLGKTMGSKNGDPYERESYCMVNEFFARCFNVPEQNMLISKFYTKVCAVQHSIECEKYKTKAEVPTAIKNPRFPHKKDEDSLSDRDKKVIGIVIVTALGCVIIVMFITLIRWMKRRGYCAGIKNIFMSNSSCGAVCGRMCVCGRNNGLDDSISISQLSLNELAERRCLNEPRHPENLIMETALQGSFTEEAPTDDKTTQTLPEELTKELLENLKEKLDDPENYIEACEMIEHLYELIKVEESCNSNTPTLVKTEENIYDLPFTTTSPRIGKNHKQMISVGTRTPSLDKLLPLSPYNRQTALAHEYFEPKDFAVHLYAEICDKGKRSLLGNIPDLVEQVVPRGPYLRAVREKKSSPTSSPSPKSLNSPTKIQMTSPSSSHFGGAMKSPTKSIKSNNSNTSGKMVNRPLPEKPINLDPGEGTSVVVG